MSDHQRVRVDYDNLPSQFPGIVDRCAGAAAPYSVENGQQQASRLYQPMVPINQAAVIILTAYIVNGIGPLENSVIPLLR